MAHISFEVVHLVRDYLRMPKWLSTKTIHRNRNSHEIRLILWELLAEVNEETLKF